MKDAKQYFDNHDSVDKLYFTSDGLAFFDEQNAVNHAKCLDDEAVSTKTRSELDKELEDITSDKWNELEYDPLDEPDAE